MNTMGIAVALLALAIAGYLFAQLRSRRIRERYVWLWLGLVAAMVVVALVPGLLEQLTALTGFRYPSNLVLTAAAAITFLITVSLSIEVSRLQMSVRTLTEEVAFLHAESAKPGASTTDESVDRGTPSGVTRPAPNDTEPS